MQPYRQPPPATERVCLSHRTGVDREVDTGRHLEEGLNGDHQFERRQWTTRADVDAGTIDDVLRRVLSTPVGIRVTKHRLVALGRRPVEIEARAGLEHEAADLSCLITFSSWRRETTAPGGLGAGDSRCLEDTRDDVRGGVMSAALGHEAAQAGEIVTSRDQARLDAAAPIWPSPMLATSALQTHLRPTVSALAPPLARNAAMGSAAHRKPTVPDSVR